MHVAVGSDRTAGTGKRGPTPIQANGPGERSSTLPVSGPLYRGFLAAVLLRPVTCDISPAGEMSRMTMRGRCHEGDSQDSPFVLNTGSWRKSRKSAVSGAFTRSSRKHREGRAMHFSFCSLLPKLPMGAARLALSFVSVLARCCCATGCAHSSCRSANRTDAAQRCAPVLPLHLPTSSQAMHWPMQG